MDEMKLPEIEAEKLEELLKEDTVNVKHKWPAKVGANGFAVSCPARCNLV